VYAEVPAPHGGYVDLLAVRGERTVAVEMKKRYSRLALRQASRNRAFVWQSLVAVADLPAFDGRRRSLFQRRGLGLLVVTPWQIQTLLPAKEKAPPCTIREAFGAHLEGPIAALYAGAAGGVPTPQRISASRELAKRAGAVIRRQGGVASTSQILEQTLGWNYFRAKRAGLAALLAARFRALAPDLWSTPERLRPAIHAWRAECLVRAQDRDLRVILDEHTALAARPGDIVWIVQEGKIVARAWLKFAGRYPVKPAPQRELRAGPAVFFPYRLPGAPPPEVIVASLAGYRELRRPRAFPRILKAPWQTLRPSSSART
jgi:hypothetical protein